MAYWDLLGALQSLDATKIKTAQAAYAERLQTCRNEAEDATRNALGDYQGKIRSAWESMQAELSTAFHQYVSRIKSEIANLRENEVDPPALALIAQSLATVAAYADQTTKFAAANPASPKP